MIRKEHFLFRLVYLVYIHTSEYNHNSTLERVIEKIMNQLIKVSLESFDLVGGDYICKNR